MLGHPFPSFWYFPSFRKAVVVMTGDEHASGDGTRDRWNSFAAASPAGCSVDDWQCVRGTSYVYRARRHERRRGRGLHRAGLRARPAREHGLRRLDAGLLESDLASELVDFAAQFPSVPAPTTNRTHCIPWSDWASQPVIELAHQIRLDTNYYVWPPSWVQDRPGFFTGSGMPMRFAQTDGSLIDVYQAATQMSNESGQSFPFTIDTLLDRALGPEGYYGAFTAYMHTDAGPRTVRRGQPTSSRGAGARRRGGLGQADADLDRRAQRLDFGAPTWNGQDLAFSVVQGLGARNLRALLPVTAGTRTLAALTSGGAPVAYSVERVEGSDFAVFAADTGSYVATYLPDTTPVLAAIPREGGTPQIREARSGATEPSEVELQADAPELDAPREELPVGRVALVVAAERSSRRPLKTLSFSNWKPNFAE